MTASLSLEEFYGDPYVVTHEVLETAAFGQWRASWCSTCRASCGQCDVDGRWVLVKPCPCCNTDRPGAAS